MSRKRRKGKNAENFRFQIYLDFRILRALMCVRFVDEKNY